MVQIEQRLACIVRQRCRCILHVPVLVCVETSLLSLHQEILPRPSTGSVIFLENLNNRNKTLFGKRMTFGRQNNFKF